MPPRLGAAGPAGAAVADETHPGGGGHAAGSGSGTGCRRRRCSARAALPTAMDSSGIRAGGWCSKSTTDSGSDGVMEDGGRWLVAGGRRQLRVADRDAVVPGRRRSRRRPPASRSRARSRSLLGGPAIGGRSSAPVVAHISVVVHEDAATLGDEVPAGRSTRPERRHPPPDVDRRGGHRDRREPRASHGQRPRWSCHWWAIGRGSASLAKSTRSRTLARGRPCSGWATSPCSAGGPCSVPTRAYASFPL